MYIDSGYMLSSLKKICLFGLIYYTGLCIVLVLVYVCILTHEYGSLNYMCLYFPFNIFI